MYRVLKGLKLNLVRSPTSPVVDIGGERKIEWSFLSAQMPNGPGEALEFGCEQGYMSLVAAQRGFHVIANDLEPQGFCWEHPTVEFVQGDFLKLNLPRNHFDLKCRLPMAHEVAMKWLERKRQGPDQPDQPSAT